MSKWLNTRTYFLYRLIGVKREIDWKYSKIYMFKSMFLRHTSHCAVSGYFFLLKHLIEVEKAEFTNLTICLSKTDEIRDYLQNKKHLPYYVVV